jgi:hypothetical protein
MARFLTEFSYPLAYLIRIYIIYIYTTNNEVMEEQATQQEVLLLTGTSFSARQHITNEEQTQGRLPDEHASLEEACWNGMLPIMLPEICSTIPTGKPVYIWKIREGAAFLEVEISDIPRDIDGYYSLDPYAYALTRNYN